MDQIVGNTCHQHRHGKFPGKGTAHGKDGVREHLEVREERLFSHLCCNTHLMIDCRWIEDTQESSYY